MENNSQEHKEKNWVALTSVVAAVFLTGFKLVVGLATGSLGILAEAAHSGLDLVAAVITLFAVRLSSHPADKRHTYGHGKVENLSAFIETVLLLLTCVWIFWEATERLFFKSVHVDVTFWAYAVVILSIIIDASRSHALKKTAKKYDSQALEADALHFSTDIWSSAVVLLGLVLTKISQVTSHKWLLQADAIAALVVALIVAWVCFELGKKTIDALLDAIPSDWQDNIKKAADVDGVIEVLQVRVRKSGAESFVDLTVSVSRDTPFQKSHQISEKIEKAVKKIIPRSDVVVHVEPVRSPNESLLASVRILAAQYGLGAHGIQIYDVLGERSIEMHLEVSENLVLEEAHRQVTRFEKKLRQDFKNIQHVITHMEPVGDEGAQKKAVPYEEESLLEILKSIHIGKGVQCHPHKISFLQVGSELVVSFHCVQDPHSNIADVHEFTEQVEKHLRNKIPNLKRVLIHTEPDDPSRH